MSKAKPRQWQRVPGAHGGLRAKNQAAAADRQQRQNLRPGKRLPELLDLLSRPHPVFGDWCYCQRGLPAPADRQLICDAALQPQAAEAERVDGRMGATA